MDSILHILIWPLIWEELKKRFQMLIHNSQFYSEMGEEICISYNENRRRIKTESEEIKNSNNSIKVKEFVPINVISTFEYNISVLNRNCSMSGEY